MPMKGEQTRKRVIAQAAPIFNVKGFAGASMSDILSATGLEKGGLYRHFRSKDELALAAFDYAVGVLEKRHDAARTGARTALERLLASVDVVESSVAQPSLRGGCPILNTAIEADDTHAALRNKAAGAMRRWQARIVAIVEDGVAAGELRADIDAASVAAVLTSALEGAIMTAVLLRDRAQMAATAAHLREWLGTLRLSRKGRAA